MPAAPPGLRPGVNLPEPAAFASATFDPLVLDGIARGAYPGAALVVGRGDTILFAKGYGRLTWSAASPPVSVDSTIWDLASLTKVVATTTALMLLSERGQVDLDAPIARYVAEFNGPGTAAITVRHALAHTSGLPATLPLRGAPDRDSAWRMVVAAVPRAAPGAGMVYSDVNAMLLGAVVERAAGEPLDRFTAREILAPLGIAAEVLFRPPRRLQRRIAPTGIWRGHPVAGVVNDPSAARLGGVAGHAGLFGTAPGTARFAQCMLREGVLPGGRRLLRAATVRAFTRIVVRPSARAARTGTASSARTLGWEAVPTGEAISSAGTLFGPRSYGHTGWTGTSLWIDPDRGLFVLLLTNRAYAPRSGHSFTILKEVRGRVADAAARAHDAS